jgi:hypothetical protein
VSRHSELDVYTSLKLAKKLFGPHPGSRGKRREVVCFIAIDVEVVLELEKVVFGANEGTGPESDLDWELRGRGPSSRSDRRIELLTKIILTIAGELASRSAIASQVKAYANFAMFPPRSLELV